MSAAFRSTHQSLTVMEHLLKFPRRFELGQAIVLLGQALQVEDPLGDGDLDRALVRLRNRRQFTPITAEVEEIQRRPDGSFDVTTGVLNVIGAVGVLPYPLSHALVRAAQRDPALGEECDRLTHRLLSIWFRAWRQASPASSESTAALARWTGIPPELAPTLASLAVLFGRTRSAAGLECLLTQCLRLPVRVEPGHGGWIFVEGMGGESADLRYDANRCVRIIVGPLARHRFQALRPGAGELRNLLRLARLYAGPAARFDVQLLLRGADVRPVVLNGAGAYLACGDVVGGDGPSTFTEAAVLVDAETCWREEGAVTAAKS